MLKAIASHEIFGCFHSVGLSCPTRSCDCHLQLLRFDTRYLDASAHSAHVLGNAVRPLGAKAHVHRLHGHALAVLRRAGARAHGRLRGPHAPSVSAGVWLREYGRIRCVSVFVPSSSALEGEGEICFESRADAARSFAGAGVIADIAAPFERGSFFGIWNIGPMIGPCLGPVVGGVLADKLGWRYFFLLCET